MMMRRLMVVMMQMQRLVLARDAHTVATHAEDMVSLVATRFRESELGELVVDDCVSASSSGVKASHGGGFDNGSARTEIQ